MKLIKSTKNISYYFIAIVLLLTFLLQLLYVETKSTVVAYASNYVAESLVLSDPNFNSSSGSTYPLTPSALTETSSYDIQGVTAGIINTNYSTFQENMDSYETNINPGSADGDNYVLMINNIAGTSFSYKTNDITLSANSHYRLAVSVYSTNNTATIDIISDGESVDFGSISYDAITNNGWTEYNFYISTSEIEGLSVNILLGVNNTKGVAFFDNLVAQQISLLDLENKTMTTSTDRYLDARIGTIYKNDNDSLFFTSYDKENSYINADYTESYVYTVTAPTIGYDLDNHVTSPGIDYRGNDVALGIINRNASYYSYISDTYTLKAGYIYEFTAYIKVQDIEEGDAFFSATEVLTEEEEEDEEVAKTTSVSIGNTTYSSTNGYQPVSIYIVSDPIFDIEIEFSFGLGTSSTYAQGSAFVTDVVENIVPYSNYSTVEEGTYIKILDFTTDYATTDVSNNTFNLYQNEKTEINDDITPFAPTDWTYGEKYSDTDTITGVIDTADTYVPGNISWHNTVGSSNMVLAIEVPNGFENVITYTSSDLTLTADEYYQFNVDIYSQSDNAFVSLISSDGIVLAQLQNINTNNNWVNYSIYFKNYSTEITANLVISLGYDEEVSNGNVYFDNVTSTLITSDTFDAKIDNTTSTELLIDLTTETLVHSNDIDSKGLYTPYLYNATRVGGYDYAYSGISYYTDEDYYTQKALVIKSNEDVYYKLSSSLSYTFVASTYYTIEVSVKTEYLNQDEDNLNYSDDSEEEVIPYGATISLPGFSDATFTGIDTEEKWDTYTFFIYPTSDTSTTLEFALGYTDALTEGNVYFSEPIISTSSESEYLAATLDYTDSNDELTLPYNMLSIGDPNSDSDEDSTTSNSGLYNADYTLITSLILVFAILIALIGFTVRKIKWKKFRRKKSNNYDRENTLIKQTYEREAIALRDERVELLKSQTKSLINEKESIESNYKFLLNNLRKLSASKLAEHKSEKAKLSKELKSSQKRLNKIVTKLNNIDLELSYISTKQYIYEYSLSLYKKSKIKMIVEDEFEENENDSDTNK